MKDCPDCGEQVADDAVHCGHCGAKVEEERSEKQTMFGVGTVDADSLKSAVDEAQGAGESDETGEDEGGRDGEEGGESAEESQTDEGSGGFRLPTPGEAGASEGDDREAAVELSTEEDDEPVESPGLPEPSEVGDGRLSVPESDAERQNPSEETAADPESGEGSSPGFSETISMDAPPNVQESDDDEDEEIPDTVPTDMAPPESGGGADGASEIAGEEQDSGSALAPTRREVDTVSPDEESGEGTTDESGDSDAMDTSDAMDNMEGEENLTVGDQEEVTGYERTVDREAASTDPNDPTDLQEAGSEAEMEVESSPGDTTGGEGASTAGREAAGSGDESGVEVADEKGGEQDVTPETAAGGRFEQADETAPPQQAQGGAKEESDRISTRTLLFIAAGLFVFCMLVCAGVIGLWSLNYI